MRNNRVIANEAGKIVLCEKLRIPRKESFFIEISAKFQLRLKEVKAARTKAGLLFE